MFRGIDPQGLDALAATLDGQTRSMRHQARAALELLHRNGKSSEAATIGSLTSRIENWNLDTIETLRWRAEAIRSGQDAGLDVFRLARAVFAVEAVFSVGTLDQAYRQWARVQEESKRAEEAVTNISDWLNQGWTDWDVTNGDLQNIRRTLEGLSGRELDRVIAGLSPRQLERWIEEMGNPINGFSRAEKQEVFSVLAANSSGEALGKIHEAILAGGGDDEAADFGVAIGRHAADQAIVSFVDYAIRQGLANHKYSGIAPALAVGGIDSSAAGDKALRAVMSSIDVLPLIVVDSLVIGGAAEPNPLDCLVGAIARSSDPRLKTATFKSMAAMATGTDAHLRDLLRTRHHIDDRVTTNYMGARDHDNRATDMLRAAEPVLLGDAAAILVSDANGVVEQLATHLDPTGSLTTEYLFALVDRDEIGQLGLLVDRLRGGDVVDPVAFSQSGTNPGYQYAHAQNLGFIAGNLRKALEQYVEDAKNDIEWISWGAKITALAVGASFMKALETMQLAGAAVENGAEWFSTDYWSSRTKDKIDDDLEALLEIAVTNLQPPLSPEGGPPRLGDALQWWDDRYDIVQAPGCDR